MSNMTQKIQLVGNKLCDHINDLRERVEKLENAATQPPSSDEATSAGEGQTWWRHPDGCRTVSDEEREPRAYEWYVTITGELRRCQSDCEIRVDVPILRPAKLYEGGPTGWLVEIGEGRPKAAQWYFDRILGEPNQSDHDWDPDWGGAWDRTILEPLPESEFQAHGVEAKEVPTPDELTYSKQDLKYHIAEVIHECHREPRTNWARSFWDRIADGDPTPYAVEVALMETGRDKPAQPTPEPEIERPVTWTDDFGDRGCIERNGNLWVHLRDGSGGYSVETSPEDRTRIRRALEAIDGIGSEDQDRVSDGAEISSEANNPEPEGELVEWVKDMLGSVHQRAVKGRHMAGWKKEQDARKIIERVRKGEKHYAEDAMRRAGVAEHEMDLAARAIADALGLYAEDVSPDSEAVVGGIEVLTERAEKAEARVRELEATLADRGAE